MSIKSIIKNTSNRFLNLFTLEVDNGKTTFPYFITSRRKEDELACVTKDHNKCDAVMIVPIIYGKGVVMIKQYRPAIDDYIYEFPAGLVNPGEDIKEAAKRELYEEIGLNVKECHEFIKPSYTSVGMTDETCSIYFAYVNGEPNNKHNTEHEDIEVKTVLFEEIEDILKNNVVSIKTSLMLRYIMDIEE